MLVLTRKVGEKIYLGENIIVTVTAVSGQQVRLGFTAPPEVSILRNELVVRGEEHQEERRTYCRERDSVLARVSFAQRDSHHSSN